MTPGQERWLRRMSCVYGALLLFYPQTFQREHGREMALLFRDSARDVLMVLASMWCDSYFTSATIGRGASVEKEST